MSKPKCPICEKYWDEKHCKHCNYYRCKCGKRQAFRQYDMNGTYVGMMCFNCFCDEYNPDWNVSEIEGTI